VDAGRQVHTIASKTAEEARLENPSTWLLCKSTDEPIYDAKDIVEGQTHRLRSTTRIDHEGQTKRFNVQEEEEDPMVLHHRIHRGLGTDTERWDILDIRGKVIAQGTQIALGIVKTSYRRQKVTISIQDRDTLVDMYLLIETLLRLSGQLETRDGRGQPVTQMEHFRHQETYSVHLISERRERSRTIIQRGSRRRSEIM
jgi:hypothetical protein